MASLAADLCSWSRPTASLLPSSLLTSHLFTCAQFIYISLEEMNAVASYIRSQGRVAISKLAEASNNLIDLEAKSWTASATRAPGIDFSDVLGDAAATEAPAS